jgi:hypothetical protein
MLSGLAVASDGVVWFAMLHSSSLGRLGDGRVDIFGLPRDGARPCSIAIDATGNVWYPDISGYVGMLPVREAVANSGNRATQMALVRYYSAFFQDQLQTPHIGDVLERIGPDHNQVGKLECSTRMCTRSNHP